MTIPGPYQAAKINWQHYVSQASAAQEAEAQDIITQVVGFLRNPTLQKLPRNARLNSALGGLRLEVAATNIVTGILASHLIGGQGYTCNAAPPDMIIRPLLDGKHTIVTIYNLDSMRVLPWVQQYLEEANKHQAAATVANPPVAPVRRKSWKLWM